MGGALVLPALVAAPRLLAFSSFLGNHVHRQITRAALAARGFAPASYIYPGPDPGGHEDGDGSDNNRGVIDVDTPDHLSHFTVVQYHCCRGVVCNGQPGEPSLTSESYKVYAATGQEVRRRHASIIARMKNVQSDGDPAIWRARRDLSFALHAIQDSFAHSNYCDLGGGARSAFSNMLIGKAKLSSSRVSGLKVVSYLGLTDGTPSKGGFADLFTHDGFCKDDTTAKYPESRKMVGGTTKFQRAKAGASRATLDFLNMIQAKLGKEQWNYLRGVPKNKPVKPLALLEGLEGLIVTASLELPAAETATGEPSVTPGLSGVIVR